MDPSDPGSKTNPSKSTGKIAKKCQEKNRAPQQQKRPATERHRRLEFVREYVVSPRRRRKKKGGLRRTEHTPINNDAARKEEHYEQGNEKKVEQDADDASRKWDLPVFHQGESFPTSSRDRSRDKQARKDDRNQSVRSIKMSPGIPNQLPAQPLKQPSLTDSTGHQRPLNDPFLSALRS
jgi:hypothetical protein